MVGFHLPYIDNFSVTRTVGVGTMTMLSFIDFTFCVFVKGPDVEVVLIMVENILINAGLLLHITVHHTPPDHRLESGGIIVSIPIAVV